MSVALAKKDMNDRGGVVTIQADGQEEVKGSAARELALREAAKSGIARPGHSGDGGAYPVDANGETSDDLMMGQGGVVGYRCDYRVTGAGG